MDLTRLLTWPRRGAVVASAAAAVLVCGATTPAFAQAPAGIAVDVATSRVYILVGKSGLVGHVHAVEGRLVSGQVTLGAREQAGTLVFDMRSFLADTPAARKMLGLEGQVDDSTQKQTNANMLGPDVLDVARHPTARFDIRSALPSVQARPGGSQAYDLIGLFTLHGAQRPLTITAEVEDRGAALRLRGGFAIKQTDFGMKPYAKFGGMVGVADELKIWGDIWMPKAIQR